MRTSKESWSEILLAKGWHHGPLHDWPKQYPFPSVDDCLLADGRHEKERLDYEASTGLQAWHDGDQNLPYKMSMQDRVFWLPYFFPEKIEDIKREFLSRCVKVTR